MSVSEIGANSYYMFSFYCMNLKTLKHRSPRKHQCLLDFKNIWSMPKYMSFNTSWNWEWTLIFKVSGKVIISGVGKTTTINRLFCCFVLQGQSVSCSSWSQTHCWPLTPYSTHTLGELALTHPYLLTSMWIIDQYCPTTCMSAYSILTSLFDHLSISAAFTNVCEMCYCEWMDCSYHDEVSSSSSSHSHQFAVAGVISCMPICWSVVITSCKMATLHIHTTVHNNHINP